MSAGADVEWEQGRRVLPALAGRGNESGKYVETSGRQAFRGHRGCGMQWPGAFLKTNSYAISMMYEGEMRSRSQNQNQNGASRAVSQGPSRSGQRVIQL